MNLKKELSDFRDLLKEYMAVCRQIWKDTDRSPEILSREEKLREKLTEISGKLMPYIRRLPNIPINYYEPMTRQSISMYDEAMSSDLFAPRKEESVYGVIQSVSKAIGASESVDIKKLNQSEKGIKNVFLAHSFNPKNKDTINTLKDLINSFPVGLLLGSKPSTKSISEKIKKMISDSVICVIVMTQDEKKSDSTWSASDWVKQEATYALGREKDIIRLIEDGVDCEGRIFGDKEYIPFNNENLTEAIVKLVQTLNGLL